MAQEAMLYAEHQWWPVNDAKTEVIAGGERIVVPVSAARTIASIMLQDEFRDMPGIRFCLVSPFGQNQFPTEGIELTPKMIELSLEMG